MLSASGLGVKSEKALIPMYQYVEEGVHIAMFDKTGARHKTRRTILIGTDQMSLDSNDHRSTLDPSTPIFKGFIRGMLPLYLLITLRERPLHGTELIKSLSEMSGHNWKPSPGSVYPVLRRLEKEGLLAGRWRRSQGAPQRVYKLTEEGKRSLPRLREELVKQLKLARDLIDSHIVAFEDGGGTHHGHA